MKKQAGRPRSLDRAQKVSLTLEQRHIDALDGSGPGKRSEMARRAIEVFFGV